MDKRGLFITFEGGEGSGKTTQIARLAESLRARGQTVVTTREPGGTPEAEKIRSLLVNREGGDWTPLAETLLLFAARVQHVENLIRPALSVGKTVLCDRFFDSTLAYQGYGHGLPAATIAAIQQAALGDFAPDLTIILDLPVEAGLGRATARGNAGEDRFERLGRPFHARMREGYLAIARQNPMRCHIVDAAGDIETIACRIASVVTKFVSAS